MKKIIALVAALTMLLSMTVFSEENESQKDDLKETVVTDNDDMTVNVRQKTGIADAMMVVDVILPRYTYSDLLAAEKAEYLNILAYSEQVVTDEEGILDMSFKLRGDSPSGSYTFVITGKDYKKEINAFVVNDDLSKAAMDAITDVLTGDNDYESNIEAIKAAICGQPAEYGIDETGYSKDFESADWKKAASLSYDYMVSEKIKEIDTTRASYIFNKAVAIVALENGMVDNIITDAELFGLGKGKLAEWHKKDFVTDFTGKRMAERLGGKAFKSFEEFDEALIESFVLSVIEKPDGSGNTKAVMQGFSDYIGTGDSGTDKRYAYVSNKKWDSYEDLKESFDGYKDPSQPSGGSGGTSGSGGSKGSYVPSASISAETSEKTQEDKKVYQLNIFNDLETVAWAEDAIITLTEKGIVNGVGNDMFAPNDFVTREEFSAMIGRAFIPDVQAVEISFSDTKKSEWYYESVAKAYAAGIVKGESENLFGTGKNITRQDMAVMLCRAGEYIRLNLAMPENYAEFSDDEMISDYAKDAVYTLRGAEIINGISDKEFAPLENATRAQAAKMIYGLLEL